MRKLLPLLVSLVLVPSCSRKDSPKQHGGQDTGGGSVSYSKPDQVMSSLDRAIQLATEATPQKNIFAQFWIDSGRNSKHAFIKHPTRLFPNMTGITEKPDLVKDAGKFESPYLLALKHNKVIRLESGDCLKSKGGKHRDASVSAFRVDADICFSISNLTHIPPSTLLREILSLVLHEATHLAGADEAEATSWQEEFSAYFGSRFGELTADNLTARTLKALGEARVLLLRAKAMAEHDPKNARIYGVVGKFAAELAALPDLSDSLAIELKLNPVNPDLINNYSNSVLALLFKIKLKFEMQVDPLFVRGIRIPINFLVPPEQMLPTLIEIGADFERVNENFLALIGDSSAKPTCIVPEGDMALPPPNSSQGPLKAKPCAEARD